MQFKSVERGLGCSQNVERGDFFPTQILDVLKIYSQVYINAREIINKNLYLD